MNLKTRLNIEKRIRDFCIDKLLAAGYYLSVDDGENETLKSTNAERLKSWMGTTDEDTLYLWKPSAESDIASFNCQGSVTFVYGNDGYDVISGHSASLEEVLAPVFNLADKLEKEHG